MMAEGRIVMAAIIGVKGQERLRDPLRGVARVLTT
jgi:hypothetical protein